MIDQMADEVTGPRCLDCGQPVGDGVEICRRCEDNRNEDLLDELHPDCRCDGDGLIVTCPDDLCRSDGGCGRFADRGCYAVCPCAAL